MEPKRFIGSDLRRLFDRIRNDLGPDAVIIRSRSLMREGADPLTEVLAVAPDGAGEFSLDVQQSITSGLLAHLEARTQSLTVGDLEDLVARDALAESVVEESAPRPPAEVESPPEWLQGFISNAPSGPSVDPGSTDKELVIGEDAESAAAEETLRRFPLPLMGELPSPPAGEDPRPPMPIARRRPARTSGHEGRTDFPASPSTDSPGTYIEGLVAAGLSAAAAQIVFQTASWEGDRRRALAATLEQRHVRYPDELQTAIITMQGAVGAGKTSALVRMALDCAESGREALLVAGDTAHAGARGQVRAYAEATGLPVIEAFDRRDIARAASRARPGTCVFVDLPAGPWQPIKTSGVGMFSYLVLPAHWQSAALEKAIAPFAIASFAGCVITFSDIATTLAPVLSTVVESRLGIAFLSSNGDIGTGIAVADPLTLASGMFTIRTGETTDGRLVASA